MARRTSRVFDWCFYNVWQKAEWVVLPLLVLGLLGWCLSALYWSPDPVRERHTHSSEHARFSLSNTTSNVLWFVQVSQNISYCYSTVNSLSCGNRFLICTLGKAPTKKVESFKTFWTANFL